MQKRTIDADMSDHETQLSVKLAFLARPENYPDRARAVDIKETHMSWLFLTEGHVYKLKKPVRYSFLDFSTVEARRQNCEAEITLNRRLAPDVYLDVLPLTLEVDGHLRLGGSGQPVDWLVKMRRLPEEQTLEYAVASGSVQEAAVRRAVARLADFYRSATPVRMSPPDYRDRIKIDIESSCRELARPLFRLPADLPKTLAAAQFGFLDTRGTLLEERARLGKLVEGHGDLRPEHIYLGPAPVILDCLEFNRELRILDPVDELAYLAMECDRLDNSSVDSWIFETYCDRTADRVPRVLIEFHKCMRACLRAKIALWHLDEPGVADPSKWTRRAHEYLRLASRYGDRLVESSAFFL